MIVASVQTAQDTAPPSWGLVLAAVVAVALIVVALSIESWLKTRRGIRHMPLPEPTVPRQLTTRNAPTLDAARRRVPSPRPGRGPTA